MNMMRTPIFPDSPCSIFALKQQLGLSEEQTKKLGSIEEKARGEARKVLTESRPRNKAAPRFLRGHQLYGRDQRVQPGSEWQADIGLSLGDPSFSPAS